MVVPTFQVHINVDMTATATLAKNGITSPRAQHPRSATALRLAAVEDEQRGLRSVVALAAVDLLLLAAGSRPRYPSATAPLPPRRGTPTDVRRGDSCLQVQVAQVHRFST